MSDLFTYKSNPSEADLEPVYFVVTSYCLACGQPSPKHHICDECKAKHGKTNDRDTEPAA